MEFNLYKFSPTTFLVSSALLFGSWPFSPLRRCRHIKSITGRGNSTNPTEMDLQQLQNDTPLESINRHLKICSIGESSTCQQQPEPEMKEEHHFPEERSYSRSVLERIETLTDRIYRQIMAEAEILSPYPRVKTLPLVNTQNIKTNDGKSKDGRLAGYEMKENFHETLKQNSRYVQLGLQPSEEVKILWSHHRVKALPLVNTQNIKTNDGKFKDGHWAEYEMIKKIPDTYELRQKLLPEKLDLLPYEVYLACAPAQDRGSCISLEPKFVQFINELCDGNNNKVEYKDFQGLKDALADTACGKVPDYLKSIAIRIEDARGKATEFSHTGIQILVCAVIKEMEDTSLEDLDWGTLKKWVAALSYANEHGFQVGFANNLLERNVVAYFQKKELYQRS